MHVCSYHSIAPPQMDYIWDQVVCEGLGKISMERDRQGETNVTLPQPHSGHNCETGQVWVLMWGVMCAWGQNQNGKGIENPVI